MPDDTLTLHIPAVHCDGCLRTVRHAVAAAGAEYVSGDAASKRVIVRAGPGHPSADDLALALEAVGFPPERRAPA